jgi:lysophospholipase L1-like esterase
MPQKMILNSSKIFFAICSTPKILAIIVAGSLLTSCTSYKPTVPASTGYVDSPIEKSNKRIQTEPAKPFAPSNLGQYLIGEPKSINSFIPASFNVFESRNPRLIEKLKNLWFSSKDSKFSIIHFGDSHVQMGLGQQISRDYLQASLGNGGRGIIFPYSIAKTYSQSDFISRYEGQWQYASSIQEYPRIPLGVSGFVAKTSDPSSSFTISFKNQLPSGNQVIKLFYRVSSPNVIANFNIDGRVQSANLAVSKNGLPAVLEIDVANFSDTVRFDFANSSKDGGTFEIYGLTIESARNNGVVYHNVGVGGATYGSVVAQSYFELQVGKLKPSLYILDYGTNDIIYKNQISAKLEATVLATISKIRAHDPNALILVMPPQNMYFRGKEITTAFNLAQMLRKTALENDCLYYDWYRIAGGAGSMSAWYSYGLARKDHIHLTDKGYALKGYLLAKAFENSVNDSNTLMATNAPLVEVNSEDSRSVSMWLKKESNLQFIPNNTIKPASNKKIQKKRQVKNK